MGGSIVGRIPSAGMIERRSASRSALRLGVGTLIAAISLVAITLSPIAYAQTDPGRTERARALLQEALTVARSLPIRTSGGLTSGFDMERRPLILVAIAVALARIDKSPETAALIEQARLEAEAVDPTGILQVAQSRVDMRVRLGLAQFRMGDEQGARATLASVESTDPRARGTYANVYGPAAVVSRVNLSDVWLEMGDRTAALRALRAAEAEVLDNDLRQFAFVAQALASRGFAPEAEALVAQVASLQSNARVGAGEAGTPLALTQFAVAQAKLAAGDLAGAAQAASAAASGSRGQCRFPSLFPHIDSVRREAGDVAGADAMWRELLGRARTESEARDRASELACLAGLQDRATDKTEALEIIQEAVATANMLSSQRDRAYVSTQINYARIRLGERDAAAAALPAELTAARAIRDKRLRHSALMRAADALTRLDRNAEAGAVLAEAGESARDPNSLVFYGEDQRFIASQQMRIGDVDGAVRTVHVITNPAILPYALVELANLLTATPAQR